MADASTPAGSAPMRAANKLQNLRATMEPAEASSTYQPPRVEPDSPAQPKKDNKDKGRPAPPSAASAGSSSSQGPYGELAADVPPPWMAVFLAGIGDQMKAGITAGINDAREQSRSRSRARGRSQTPRDESRALGNPGLDEARATTETAPPRQAPREHINHWKPKWPATLDDGVTVLFWPWKMKCENIFRNHAADFPLLEDKLELLLESTAGKAQRALQARMIPDSLNPILELEDAWDCLKSVTVDPTEMIKADNEFRFLTMKDTDTFTDFIAEFQDLSAKAQLLDPVKARKDLWNKLNGRLQNSMMSIEADLLTFEQLMNRAAHVDVQSSYSNIKAPRGGFAPAKPKEDTKRKVNTGAGYVPAAGNLSGRAGTPFERASTPRVRFNTPDKDDSKKICYNCGQVGHISPNCPIPKAGVNEIDLDAEMNQLEELEEEGKVDS